MKRKLQNELMIWYEKKESTSLLLQGAKGVGKTRLIFDFIHSLNDDKIYINFEHSPKLASLFQNNTLIEIIQNIFDYFQLKSNQKIIIILDEIYRTSEVYNLLSMDLQNQSNIRFIFISSFSLPPYIHYSNDLTKLYLYPLNFEEFLDAIGHEWYIGVIKEHFYSNQPIPDILHHELLELFDEFLIIGGMPLAVNEYITMNSNLNISEQHIIIKNHYFNTLKDILTEGEYLKTNQIYETLDQQLTKKNKKFYYTLIRKGATKKIYQNAMSVLIHSNFLIQSTKQNIKTRDDIKTSDDACKIYLLDTGILLTKAKSHMLSTTVESVNYFQSGLLENYIAIELYNKGYILNYWESPSGAKIDFIIKKDGDYIPIEVYDTPITRSKALSIYKSFSSIEFSIKISPKNFFFHNDTKYIPLYAVFCI